MEIRHLIKVLLFLSSFQLATTTHALDGPERITRHALSAPSASEQSVTALAAHLAPPAMTPIDRAWSIFVWIGDRVDYDIEAYLAGRVRDEKVTAEDVLRKRRTVCDGFAALYAALARAAGLEVMIVQGYAKAYGVKTHETFIKPNHAWILLKLGGAWHTIDPTWGAGYVNHDAYTKLRDTVYFYGQAEELQFTHRPLEEIWRVAMGQDMSKAEFEIKPRIDAGLFRAGVSGSAIGAAIAAPGYAGLVTVFEQNHRGLKVRSIPLGARLRAYQTYRFALEAAAFEDIVVMHDGDIVSLSRQGDRFEGEVRPVPGSLLIGGRPKEDGRLSGLFQYTVD